MERKKVLPLLIVGVLAIAAAFGAVTYSSVKAQAVTPTPDTSTAPALPGMGMKFRGGERGGVTEEGLATALGITTDELSTAYQTATTEALKQAVAAGLITQAQADQFAANGLVGRHLGFLNNNGIDYEALLANALGITTSELQAARTQALNASIDQAVADGTLTQAQADLMKGRHALFTNDAFQTSMKSAFEAAVNQAVSSGVITQAQADAILQAAAGKTFFGGMGPGFGGMRGGHRGMHDFGGAPVDPGTSLPVTPSTDSSGGDL